MLREFKKEFNASGITFNQKVLLAVSGGVDSMVLWHLTHHAKKFHGVAHVNFSLREGESDLDQQMVRDQAADWGVAFHTTKVDAAAYANERGISIQMAAREIRYDFFEELKQKEGYEVLATAHHLEDNIETFLINLDRGTGLRGLRGISSTFDRYRPLLQFTKDEIKAYAQKNKIIFREDQSNLDIKYQRNWFRHMIIKPWKDRNPGFLEKMKSNLTYLNEANLLLDEIIKKETKELRKQLEKGYLDKEMVNQLSKPKLFLFYLLSPYGFNESQLKDLLKCMKQNQAGKTFLSQTHALLVDRTKLFLNLKEEAKTDETAFWLVDEVCNIIEPIGLRSRRVERFNFKFKKNRKVEGFDFEKLSFPLELRKWKQGDRMKPLGMSGMKKVSDILIDEKVSLEDKKEVYVLSSKDEIVWLVGIKSDDRFKLTEGSHQIMEITTKWA
ncbi:MAG: tRNA lysidine(34) synthetase TilS [Flavobacteriales bacterium]|nr:tRNA lysidine(34) synthetase TilS [Flavobacteriales bacterium]